MAPGNEWVRYGRRAFEFFILVAGAAVMIAAASDVARGAGPPVTQSTEREVIPGADRMTSA